MNIHNQRLQVLSALKKIGKQVTAKELAKITGLDYYMIQRRVSEIPEIERTGIKKDPETGAFLTLLRINA